MRILSRFLAMILLSVVAHGVAEAQTVGTVTKVENQAQIGGAAAVVGTPVHMDDELRTGLKPVWKSPFGTTPNLRWAKMPRL